MLKHLTLRDFAVVSQAELAFQSGLTVISGETGAGKSLLVDALLSLTGARADAGVVRHGAQRAELAAEFDLADCRAALEWLKEAELDDESGCQLRRVIRADGGSRAWINGRPATLAQLGELGALLVEIHGQHEHQALLARAHQLELLDAFGGHEALLAGVGAPAHAWMALERQLQELSRTGDVSERIAYLEHQSAELAAETVSSEEISELLAAHRRQSDCAGLLACYDGALARLGIDDGLGLSRSIRQLGVELARHAGSEPRLGEATALLESAEIQLDEAASLLERLRDDLDLDGGQLELLDSRLTRLHELGRKHRVPITDLARRRDELLAELEGLRGIDVRREALLEDRERQASAWRAAAGKLGAARAIASERLGLAVSGLMGELGMEGGVLSIELQANDSDKPQASGSERCEFMVSANPGQPPRALRKVASGGELARISLAIEVAALGMDSVPSMIFDEVDSGIGGAVAEVVGQKLRALGSERQVLCVTHLPQVAAQGHHHFQVSKAVSAGGTSSAVKALSPAERVEELARMLGGLEITRETRANARQMLSRAQS